MTTPLPIPGFSPLDQDLRNLGYGVRCTIFQTLSWPGPPLNDDFYFNYYRRQCEAFSNGPGRDCKLVKTHQDIIKIIALLKAKRATRGSVKRQICSLFLCSAAASPEQQGADEEFAEYWIDLALRIWLMIDCGTVPHCIIPGQVSIKLKDQDMIGNLKWAFPVSPSHLSVKLTKQFKAQNLVEIAGIEVVWTDNLADHLHLLEDDDYKVCIFHHVTFLRCQETNPVFPPGFIAETLRTLSILLPRLDKDSRKWFNKQISESKRNYSPIDPEVHQIAPTEGDWRTAKPGGYWTYRLHLLKQVYDESEPRTMGQWWRDRRKRTLWYTFWVAIFVLVFTVFFGVVQSVEGALQVYKAYHPG